MKRIDNPKMCDVIDNFIAFFGGWNAKINWSVIDHYFLYVFR
jgi:hypothetical protein